MKWTLLLWSHCARMSCAVLCALLLLSATAAHAALIDSGLGGTTSFDSWNDLSESSYSGYGEFWMPSFPFPPATWPGPMVANEAGSGDGELTRISGPAYAANASIYSPFSPSQLQVTDPTPLSGLETIVFTVRIGDGLESFVEPTLTYNGGSLFGGDGSATTQWNLGSVTEAFDTSEGVFIADITTLVYQWDLTALGATDFDIDFTMGSHATMYGLQLEQSDVYSLASPQSLIQGVPEPHTVALGLAGLACILALCRLRRRRPTAHAS